MSVLFRGRTDVAPFEVYRALRLLNPSPYMFYFDFDDLQVVGSSPEALVKLNGTTASLRPIAGTLPRGEDSETDIANEKALLADPKEAAEHVMLVDLARNDLGRVARAGTVEVEPYRAIERYSHVMHIVSGVQGELAPEYDQFDLFAASFPAGTLVGAPKVRAMQIIEEMEAVGRGLYAGTAGYFGLGGDMDQAIPFGHWFFPVMNTVSRLAQASLPTQRRPTSIARCSPRALFCGAHLKWPGRVCSADATDR